MRGNEFKSWYTSHKIHVPFSKASYDTSKRSRLAGSIPSASLDVTEKNGASNAAMSSFKKNPAFDVIYAGS